MTDKNCLYLIESETITISVEKSSNSKNLVSEFLKFVLFSTSKTALGNCRLLIQTTSMLLIFLITVEKVNCGNFSREITSFNFLLRNGLFLSCGGMYDLY